MRTLFFCLCLCSTSLLVAQDPLLPQPKKNDWFTKAVKKFDASVEPAEAKPGQVVTFKITLHLNDGYTTYPVKQVDKQAEGMVNTIKLPEPGSVIFVGETIDPPKFSKKAEPDIGIKELRYYTGKIVYEHKLVVNPTQKPGEITLKLTEFKLTVCDANNCFPPKKLMPEAKLKVLPGPAVAVAAEFADEVKKALGGL